MHKRILFIPLDDRPCTFKMPPRMGRIARCELVHPPAELLGVAHTPGSCDELLQWLDGLSESFDAAIISVEMLLFGGLIASRKADTPFDTVQERLKTFVSILREKRESLGNVYLFKTIMRAAPTYTDEAMVPVIKKLVELSCKRYQAECGRPGALEAALKLEREVPKPLLESYLMARRRNHEINKDLVALMGEENIRFLLFGVDDSRTTGLNVKEREELEAKIRDNNLESRIMIVPGTDESALLLLARALNEFTDSEPKVFTHYSHPHGKTVVPAYEDRSFQEIVRLHIAATRCQPAESREAADFLFYLHVPGDTQREAAAQSFHPRGNRMLKRFVTELKEDLVSGRHVGLVDAFYANGADTSFMCDLVCNVSIGDLWGFAGWNTAGNSIGTSLAHAVVCNAAQKLITTPDDEEMSATAHLALLVERFADDWLYQALIRQHASAEALVRRVSAFHLDQWTDHFNDLIETKMTKAAGDFFKKYVEGRSMKGILDRHFSAEPLKGVRVRLPWDRLFEVDIEMDFSLGSAMRAAATGEAITGAACRQDCIDAAYTESPQRTLR